MVIYSQKLGYSKESTLHVLYNRVINLTITTNDFI